MSLRRLNRSHHLGHNAVRQLPCGWPWLTLGILIADLAVKAAIQAWLPVYASVALWPGVLQLTHLQNTGAAFGMFANATWPLVGFTAVVSLALLVALVWRGMFWPKPERLALAVMLGGALGNLIDRLLNAGRVTDFIDLRLFHYPVFNLADIAITGGVLWWAWLQWRKGAGNQDIARSEQ